MNHSIIVTVNITSDDPRHYPGELRAFFERLRSITFHTGNDCEVVANLIETPYLLETPYLRARAQSRD